MKKIVCKKFRKNNKFVINQVDKISYIKLKFIFGHKYIIQLYYAPIK